MTTQNHGDQNAIDFNVEDSNTSSNSHIDTLITNRLGRVSRRGILQAAGGVLATSSVSLLGVGAIAATPSSAQAQDKSASKLLGFNAVAKSLSDQVQVPDGYQFDIIYALGDPLAADVAAFKNDGNDEQWEQRAGDHHDGMEWYGLDANGKPSSTYAKRGLIAMNHEATTDEKLSSFFIHANGGASTLPRPASEVDKELMIHGLSVVEVKEQAGKWSTVQNSPFNRRVTTMTECAIHGPAKGSAHLATKYDPSGTKSRGTLNNCGSGNTPWGTYVSGEENWFGYFNRSKDDDKARGKDKNVAALIRYGRKAGDASRHGWESAGSEDKYARWNNSAVGASAADDYRNEMNTFGYVVEIDPYDKNQKMRKRTALGRMGHENITFAKPVVGQPLVAYMGDDARGEYIYKFVSKAKWQASDARPANPISTGDKYLDQGTLYAAKFHDDGRGEWLELSMNNPYIAANPDFEFKDAADIAIFTRLAADAAGATKMDRPEWGGVNPKTGEVYFTLTNNSNRSLEGAVSVDSANPRYYEDDKAGKTQKGNVNGHIIRFGEKRPTDTEFKWDIYLFASEAGADKDKVNLSNLTDANDLSSPDGLWFSGSSGICWVQTDDGAYTDKTNCMLMAALPGRVGDGTKKTLSYERKDGSTASVDTYIGKAPSEATFKRFLVGPKSCEITGICETPDGRALFINIQHPGENTKMGDIASPDKFESQWPANAGYGAGKRPRSATILITKKDGGVVGT